MMKKILMFYLIVYVVFADEISNSTAQESSLSYLQHQIEESRNSIKKKQQLSFNTYISNTTTIYNNTYYNNNTYVDNTTNIDNTTNVNTNSGLKTSFSTVAILSVIQALCLI